ncbi:hypothetical protein XO10_01600 [Marinitoga sp. 1135]|uniref:Uncharacterized protein n=1 Tax=Marinitoga piezophila (strain DSM 14283 / JCM 11233 / KA3) TaxID=443254 RepID=H2J3X3_MARPK|nr:MULTISPECIES: hypothetical protein [Marinitoga]AEX84701.1 hypothetical protein Marpi_0249 [Marinitoga piezophila KA3]APT75227.1 hypothetical protein LN42_01570 [Marinitoga sp. 1137]NUU95006.1 hypothetical protein [Marinitoga sp. 1135]NUU96962.1 hypothetical protein [Marinitoga sp. 1138]
MDQVLKEKLWDFLVLFITLIGTIYIFTSFVLEYINNNIIFKEHFYGFLKIFVNTVDLKKIVIFSAILLFVIISLEMIANILILKILRVKIDKVKFFLAFLIINGLTSLINILMLYLVSPSIKTVIILYILITLINNFLVFQEDLGKQKLKYIKFQIFIFLIMSLFVTII